MKLFDAPSRLDEHILRSYSSLRWTMAVVGIVFPFLLMIGGTYGIYRFWGLQGPNAIPVQDSLSAYYHAGFACIAHKGALRDIFVGSLWTISFCLVIYTGFGKLENWLLNFAGIALLGVAFFPTDWPAPKVIESCRLNPPYLIYNWRPVAGLPSWMSMHTISAVVFYLLIAAVTIFTVMDTVKVLPEGSRKRKWMRVYQGKWIRLGSWNVFMPGTRWIMLYAIIPCVLSFFLDRQRFVLWIELIGIMAFGTYWALKSFEILDSKLDFAVIRNEYMWDAGALKENK
jgi:hypothetical protein